MMNLRTGIMMAMLGFCGGIFGGYVVMQLTHKAVSAEQFILVDKKGQIQAMLGTTNLGTPSLGIWDRAGKNRLIIGLIAEDTPGIGLNDANGTRRADLRIDTSGKAGLIFYDAAGKALWSAPAERPSTR